MTRYQREETATALVDSELKFLSLNDLQSVCLAYPTVIRRLEAIARKFQRRKNIAKLAMFSRSGRAVDEEEASAVDLLPGHLETMHDQDLPTVSDARITGSRSTMAEHAEEDVAGQHPFRTAAASGQSTQEARLPALGESTALMTEEEAKLALESQQQQQQQHLHRNQSPLPISNFSARDAHRGLHEAGNVNALSLADTSRRRLEDERQDGVLIVGEEARLLREEMVRFQAQVSSEMGELVKIVQRQNEQLASIAAKRSRSQP